MIPVLWSMSRIINFFFEAKRSRQLRTVTKLTFFNQKSPELHPALVDRKRTILFNANAKTNSALVTQQKLRELRYEVLPHPALLIHRTLRPRIFIYSIIWLTSFMDRFSTIKSLSKPLLKLSSTPENQASTEKAYKLY